METRIEIFYQVRDMIVAVCRDYSNKLIVDTDITENSTKEDLGMDSIDEVDLAFRIESAFAISIPIEWQMTTVGSLIDLIIELKK